MQPPRPRVSDAELAARVRANGWLAACPPDFAAWVAGSLVWRTVPRGEALSHAGDDGGAVQFLADGQVTFHLGLGHDLVTAYFAFPGAWWGPASLFGKPRVGSAVARSNSTIGALPAIRLRARLEAHPGDWEHLAHGLVDVAMMSAGAHSDLLIEGARPRLAATLLRLGTNRHRIFPLLVPPAFACTQEELARAAGLSRNTCGLHLRSFVREGHVRVGYGELAIQDAPALAAIANSLD
jgi:CRP-like cAMP-binding protein